MSRPRAIWSMALLWLGSVTAGGLTFLCQVVQARELGPAAYGMFAAALGVVTLVSPLASFGLGGLWLRLFGLEGWAAVRWLRQSLRYATISTVGVILLVLIWAIIGPHDLETGKLLAILSLFIVGQACLELVSARLQLEARYTSLSLWQFVPHLLRLLLLVGLVLTISVDAEPWMIAWIYTSVSIAMGLVGVVRIRAMRNGDFQLAGHGPRPERTERGEAIRLLDVLTQAWPFGAAGVFHLIYFQSNIILLMYLRGDEAAGIYGVAYTVMAAAYMLPSVVYQKFLLPKIHRWAVHDQLQFRQALRTGSRAMLLLGALTMIVVMIASPIFVPLLFGDKYQPAVPLLSILAIAAPMRFLATSVGSVLVTNSYMRLKVRLMGLTALANVALNLALIPEYGMVGAAFSTVLSELLLLTLYAYGAKKYFAEQRDDLGRV